MGRVSVMVDAEGRLVLPAEIRQSLGLEAGGELIMEMQHHELRASTRAAAIRHAQEMVAAMVPPGVSLAEELIAERRAEAKRALDG